MARRSDSAQAANAAQTLLQTDNSDGARPAYERFLPGATLATCLLLLLSRFFHGDRLFLAFFEDDFFYYLVVAKHLAYQGLSTFNGIQLTNGYHPLWLFTITAFVRVLGDRTSLFVALTFLIWLLLCGFFRSLRRTQQALGLPTALQLPFAIFALACAAIVSRSGMEVSLTLFLLASFWQRMSERPLEEQSPAAAVGSGLLAALLMLSRIDSIFVVVAYSLLTLYQPVTSRRLATARLFWFSVGALPIAVYLLLNHSHFGTFLPISAMAKNLKPGFLPSPRTLGSLLKPRFVTLCFTWPALLLCVAFLRQRGRAQGGSVPAAGERVQLSVVLHPLLFYGVLSFTSNWPTFTWYLYPLAPVLALVGPAVAARWVDGGVARERVAWAVVALSLLSLVGLATAPRWNLFIYRAARDLRDFAATHPGRYAMGAGAGTPAYLMSDPMLQMEGLTADRAYLDRIRQRQPLADVLRDLRVDYYATMFAHRRGSCYVMREPQLAAPPSPAIGGPICTPPAAIFKQPGEFDVVVFDVRSLQGANAAPASSR